MCLVCLQNHRRYVKSRSDAQLMGSLLELDSVSECDPLRTITKNGVTYTLNPCGLIANRYEMHQVMACITALLIYDEAKAAT